MTFDLERILERKRVHRACLAALPVGAKLRILDALRERELALHGRSVGADSAPRRVRDQSVPYHSEPE